MPQALRVLFVEDQADLRELMAEVFSDLGMHVRTAPDAESAYQMLLSGIEIDVLFSDVYMPGQMTGAELCMRVLKLLPQVRIVLASGHARHQLPSLPGEIDFIQKPYSLDKVVKLLRGGLAQVA
jgi:DNA-binding NtrC family response regulator